LVASLQLTEVVQVSPQLFTFGMHEPYVLHDWIVQKGPVPASESDAPHGVPSGAYVVVHRPFPSHLRPHVGSDDAVQYELGSVPAAALTHLPVASHALHPALHALSQQNPPTQ